MKRITNLSENLTYSNYKIINDQAYTEDGILIYNLQAYTKNTKIILEEISEYFENFGKNIKVSLEKRHNYLIEFKDSKEAATVLQKSQLLIANSKVYVKPCCSWLQPHIKNIKNYVNQTHNSHEFSELYKFNNYFAHKICSISQLNDDCLMEIFRKLSIQDQINFALCGHRFCDILQQISYAKYSNLNMELLTVLNCFQIKIFGLIVGPYIKVLKFYEFKYAQLFCTYCLNVETLTIDFVSLESKLLNVWIKQMPKIKKLVLKDILWNDISINNLKLFKNLQNLYISSDDVTGEHLASLDHLTALSLYNCYSLDSKYINEICKNLRNLHYLDIRNCNGLTSNDFEYILENLLQLETLKFTNTEENFDCIARLPLLKVLEINSWKLIEYKEFSNNFLKELVKHQANQLIELKLDNININLQQFLLIAQLKELKVLYCCNNKMLNDECLEKLTHLTKLQELDIHNCSDISNEGILKLLECCLELRKLNLVGCQNLTSNVIRNILTLLQQQYVKCLRTHRIHINVEDTDLFRDIVDELGLRTANSLLKITFEKTIVLASRINRNHNNDYPINRCRAFSTQRYNKPLFRYTPRPFKI